MATDAEGQSRQGMDIPSLSLFKFVSGIPAVLDLRVLSGSDGSRRVSRRSMKGAEQSYKHQTDEWQCELHRDPFISARALKQSEAEQQWGYGLNGRGTIWNIYVDRCAGIQLWKNRI